MKQSDEGLATAELHQSAFVVLGVTPRDNRKRIVELAEEKSLELDSGICQKARSDLTNPRTRLGVEIAWLPGVSPHKANQLLEKLLRNPAAIRGVSGVPTLAHLNLLAAALERAEGRHDTDDLASFIMQIANLAEGLVAEEVLRDLNEDRTISGFPEVRGIEQVKAELAERKRYYRGVINDALNRLPQPTLVQVLTKIVDVATARGERRAPELIDEVVDSYEVDVQGLLEEEAEKIYRIISEVEEHSAFTEAAVSPYINRLAIAARNWEKIALPIQLSAKLRGITHEASCDLCNRIRIFSVELWNEHDLLKSAQQLTSLICEVFAEVPALAERGAKEADFLQEIQLKKKEEAEAKSIQNIVDEVLSNIERAPATADRDGRRLLDEGLALLKSSAIRRGSSKYEDTQNILSFGIMQCAIAFGNQTSRWAPCLSLLEKAQQLASDEQLQEKLNENLKTVRSNLENFSDIEPIKRAPPLRTVNGMGTILYGNTDQKPDGSHMATYFFVFFAIPVFPIARYRVIPTAGGYRFLGKAPLRPFDYWPLALVAVVILFGLING